MKQYLLLLALISSSASAFFNQLESAALTIGKPFEYGFEMLCKANDYISGPDAAQPKNQFLVEVTNNALAINNATTNETVKAVISQARYYLNGYEVKHGQSRRIPFTEKNKCRIRVYARTQDFINTFSALKTVLSITGIIIDFEYNFDYDITDGVSIGDLLADKLTLWHENTPNYSLSYRPPLYIRVVIKE